MKLLTLFNFVPFEIKEVGSRKKTNLIKGWISNFSLDITKELEGNPFEIRSKSGPNGPHWMKQQRDEPSHSIDPMPHAITLITLINVRFKDRKS